MCSSARWRGLAKVTCVALLAAITSNLNRALRLRQGPKPFVRHLLID